MTYSVERYHDISAGHRVVGHESKCRHIHGHNYRIHFVCVPQDWVDGGELQSGNLDEIGRVIDFGVIKERLAMWLEEVWDHKTLMWVKDPMVKVLHSSMKDSVVVVPFNPTAENMARFLVEVVGPAQLKGTGVVLQTVRIDETRKCSATYSIAR